MVEQHIDLLVAIFLLTLLSIPVIGGIALLTWLVDGAIRHWRDGDDF